MSAWRCRVEILGLPTSPPSSTVTIDIYLPLPSAIHTVYRLSRLISAEIDRALGLTTDTLIVDLIRASWPYDWRNSTGGRLYRLEDDGLGNWGWMLEEVRRGAGHLKVEGRLVRRYLVTPLVLRSRSRSWSRSRSAARHSQYGTCPSCRGVCVQDTVSAGATRRPSSGERSLGCGPRCLACSEDSTKESEENDFDRILGR